LTYKNNTILTNISKMASLKIKIWRKNKKSIKFLLHWCNLLHKWTFKSSKT